MAATFVVKSNITERLKKFKQISSPGGFADFIAKKALGLQLLNNVVNGSPKEPIIPPILTGALQASGSVFVGNKFILDTSSRAVSGGDAPTPNKFFREKNTTVTVGFNRPYAARWHENPFIPGPVSQQAGSVGNKYLEKHLKADGPELYSLYAAKLKGALSKA